MPRATLQKTKETSQIANGLKGLLPRCSAPLGIGSSAICSENHVAMKGGEGQGKRHHWKGSWKMPELQRGRVTSVANKDARSRAGGTKTEAGRAFFGPTQDDCPQSRRNWHAQETARSEGRKAIDQKCRRSRTAANREKAQNATEKRRSNAEAGPTEICGEPADSRFSVICAFPIKIRSQTGRCRIGRGQDPLVPQAIAATELIKCRPSG